MPRTKVKQSDKPEWHETKKFKTLNAKWHRKLERSGFEDIEEFDSLEEERLKSHHNMKFFPVFNSGEFLDRQRYYELAGQLVYSYPFKSEIDKRVWELHSQGVTERGIPKKVACSYAYARKVIKEVKQAIKRDAKVILEDLKKAKNDRED